MPFSLQELRVAADRRVAARDLNEARRLGLRTAFLCHSHVDHALAQGLINLFRESGWDLYVDWKDTSMPPVPDRQTATKIQGKIQTMDLFLFLATPNSTASRWCPWEIGFADGKKPVKSILIIQTIDDGGRWHGNEYLQLYRRIDRDTFRRLGWAEPGVTVLKSMASL